MLISSLTDHASPGHKILGSISSLHLYGELSEHFSLNHLPSCVTEHITDIDVGFLLNSSIPALSERILTLSDLTVVSLRYKEPCEDDYLLYQSLQSLTKLKRLSIFCSGCTSRGARELSKVTPLLKRSHFTTLYLLLHLQYVTCLNWIQLQRLCCLPPQLHHCALTFHSRSQVELKSRLVVIYRVAFIH